MRTIKAHQVARKGHFGQVDKKGEDYIKHPERMAAKSNNESEVIISLLHDLVEDTGYSVESLAMYCDLIKEEIEALNLLTRNSETYFEYIEKIKASSNSLAKKVKILDLEDHLSDSSAITPSLVKRYEKALNMLLGGSHG